MTSLGSCEVIAPSCAPGARRSLQVTNSPLASLHGRPAAAGEEWEGWEEETGSSPGRSCCARGVLGLGRECPAPAGRENAPWESTVSVCARGRGWCGAPSLNPALPSDRWCLGPGLWCPVSPTWKPLFLASFSLVRRGSRSLEVGGVGCGRG